MIELIAKRIAHLSGASRQLSEDDLEVYCYGLEIIISTVIDVAAFFLSALLFDRMAEGVAFLLCFIVLRQFTGGYHAKTYLGCFLVFLAISLTMFVLARSIPASSLTPVSVCMAVLGSIPILLLAPVPNANRPMSAGRRKLFRKISLLSAAGLVLMILAASFSGFPPSVIFGISYAIFAIGLSMVVNPKKREV